MMFFESAFGVITVLAVIAALGLAPSTQPAGGNAAHAHVATHGAAR